MEKRYFVLQKGYLNIDEDFFYFSDHGDWETFGVLKETDIPRLTFFYASNYLIKVAYLILAIAFSLLLLTGEVQFSGFVLLFMAIIHLINYRYQSKYFKIPIHKIEELILTKRKLTVTFLNRKNTSIKHTVKLDDQGETKDIRHYLQAYFQPKFRIA